MSMLRKFTPYILALTIFGAMFLIGTLGQASADAPIVAQNRFTGWEYISTIDADGSIVTQVAYRHGSIAELQQYVQENKRLAVQLDEAGVAEVDTVVTLNRALPLADFEAWAAAQPLQVRSYTMRLMGKNGERITLGGGPTANGPVDAEMLKSVLDHLADRGAVDLRGVISLEGTVRLADYDRLATDPSIFLVDVTTSFVRNELNKNASLHGKQQYFTVSPAFWYLEDLGLTK